MKIRFALCLLPSLMIPASAQDPVKIIGIGATTCRQFVHDATTTPATQRQYLAWLQGYLSGIVIGRPAGVDEGIDLIPEDFPLSAQLKFVRDYCLSVPSASFADAIEALFREFRRLSSVTKS
ncbi:MAG: hypothetical protein J0H17_19540 [Rhizobiales bacterium]|nr:hypothetical protein [Hyphomicrobiales bacterium]